MERTKKFAWKTRTLSMFSCGLALLFRLLCAFDRLSNIFEKVELVLQGCHLLLTLIEMKLENKLTKSPLEYVAVLSSAMLIHRNFYGGSKMWEFVDATHFCLQNFAAGVHTVCWLSGVIALYKHVDHLHKSE
ncbi:unnamed protein product [Cuscuta epithymum]|uniref:Post-GPI attachment to proteins factor 3 n=1 Tax=Cuscuta epithymum TaxID=186058 RepID=A0AAV0E4Q8_9ASTE|nr:unnamed protein product [Cuscuta epithymum]